MCASTLHKIIHKGLNVQVETHVPSESAGLSGFGPFSLLLSLKQLLRALNVQAGWFRRNIIL